MTTEKKLFVDELESGPIREGGWSGHEEAILRRYYPRGVSAALIADSLNRRFSTRRSVSAVQHKINRMGLFREHKVLD